MSNLGLVIIIYNYYKIGFRYTIECALYNRANSGAAADGRTSRCFSMTLCIHKTRGIKRVAAEQPSPDMDSWLMTNKS